MLTPVEFEQLKKDILRDLRTVLEADPDFAVFIEGIVAEKFPRRDEFARLLDEVALLRGEQREGFRGVYERLDRHEAAIVELRVGQEELRVGQAELRRDVNELRAGQEELRVGQAELRQELHREVANLTALINERTEMLRQEFHKAITTLGQRWGYPHRGCFPPNYGYRH